MFATVAARTAIRTIAATATANGVTTTTGPVVSTVNTNSALVMVLPATLMLAVYAPEPAALLVSARVSGSLMLALSAAAALLLSARASVSVMLALMAAIGDRFARYLPPNFCVQLADGVTHKELRLFLDPALRNSLTMCFAFKMKVKFLAPYGVKLDSEDSLKSLFQLMRSKLLHIEKLEMGFDNDYSKQLAESNTLRSAMLASLHACGRIRRRTHHA